MFKNQRGFTLFELVIVLLWLAAIGGWAANIVKLVAMSTDDMKMFILRCIGIVVAPLGVVLGFL